MSLKDLFDKEKGVLHKAEKRLASAEEHLETKGKRQTGDEMERTLAYLDKNREAYQKLKPEFSRVYTRLGEEAGFNWMYQRLAFSHTGSLWDRMALADLRQQLLDLHRAVTECVLAGKPDDPIAALEDFLVEHAAHIERVAELQQRAAGATTPSALSVIAARLDCLRALPDRRPESPTPA